jgi:endonuclease-3
MNPYTDEVEAAPGSDMNASKRTFDIDQVIRRIRAAVSPFARAAMFELADDGFASPFEQLVACIISIRTRDEITVPTARKLFERARTPLEVSGLTPSEIDYLIRACSFHERKAKQIRRIARQVVDEYEGELPCEAAALLSFEGVGLKCASLVLGIACDQPRVGVDIHVHRVTNRWGYVRTQSPAHTAVALEGKLPHRYWVEINSLLVPFGKHICTGAMPRCSECPVLEFCRQVGVERHR